MGWVACSVGNAAIRFGGMRGNPLMGARQRGPGRGTKGGCFLWRCEMRELGERGKGGFEGGELEVGDGHGENPSFSIPFSSSSLDCLLEFSLSNLTVPLDGQGKGDEEILQGGKPDTLHPLFHLCLNGKAFKKNFHCSSHIYISCLRIKTLI